MVGNATLAANGNTNRQRHHLFDFAAECAFLNGFLMQPCEAGHRPRNLPPQLGKTLFEGFVHFNVVGFHYPAFQTTTSICGSMITSDFTEFATRLYLRAALRARLARASTALGSSSPAAMRMIGQKRKWVNISVRSSSISLVPSARQS